MISFAQTVRLSRPEINVLQMTSNFNDHVSDVLLLECRQRRLADPLVSYTADLQTRFCSSFSRTTVVCYSPFPSYEYQLSQMDPRDALPRVLRAVNSRRGQLAEAAIGATLYVTMVTCNFTHNAATVSSHHGKKFQQLTLRQ